MDGPRGQGRRRAERCHHRQPSVGVGACPSQSSGGQTRQALAAARARRMDAELVGERRVGQQPHRRPGAPHHRDAAGHRRGRRWRPEQEGLGRRARRDVGVEEHHQRNGRSAQRIHFRGHARCPRGGHRGQARSGRRGHDRGRRCVERPHRQCQPDGRQFDRTSAQHCRGDHRSGQRRFEQEDLDRRKGRIPRTEEHRQRDGRSAERVRR